MQAMGKGRQSMGDARKLPANFPIDDLIDMLRLGIVVVRENGEIVYANERFREFFSLREEDLQKNIEEVFKFLFPDYSPVSPPIRLGVVRGEDVFVWRTEEGRRVFQRFSIPLPEGGAVVAFRETQEPIVLDEKLLRADRLSLIGQMAAGTAHEIRNPLTAIRGFLQLLLPSLEGKGLEQEANYVRLILKEVDRIGSLIDQFLLLGKPREVNYKKVDVLGVLRDLMPVIESETLLRDTELVLSLPGSLPPVIADPDLLKQVFLNVVRNALEAMERGGMLTISAEYDPEERQIHFAFADTGPGIPPYLLDRIFDPFFTTKPEGTGLGLSVCQRLLQDIGGNIRLTSKGRGTTAHIYLPTVGGA